jgi:Carbohydrate family 9 binding domain-like
MRYMNRKARALVIVAILLFALMSCNFPDVNLAGGGQATPMPAVNQTLTALFAVTQPSSPTATLPPVVTATKAIETAITTVPLPTQPPKVAPTNTVIVLPTATPTTAPQPAATIPSVRPTGLVLAKYLTTPPTIDGDWSEWKDITKEYPSNFVVWGANNWTGADDLSSSFHVGWDNNYLYIAMKVHDDKYVQNSTGANIYKGDSLELLLDTHLQEDFYYNQLSPDDFQLGISPGRPDPNGTKEAYLWFPSNIAGSRGNIKIAALLETGIYRVEAAIPWSVFEMTPVNGQQYGFTLSVNDDDDPNNAVQQSMVSDVANRHLTDPTTWGTLQLVK